MMDTGTLDLLSSGCARGLGAFFLPGAAQVGEEGDKGEREGGERERERDRWSEVIVVF